MTAPLRRLRSLDLRLTLLGLALAVTGVVAAGAKDRAVAATDGLEAKLESCKSCHGLSALG
jgi:cytochrome c553